MQFVCCYYIDIKGGDERYFELSMMSGFVCCFVVGGMVWAVTVYPNSLYDTNSTSDRDPSVDVTRSDSHLGWEHVVIKNVEILHSFMRFLCRSLCVENMLFLIETMQFKQEFMKKRKINMKSSDNFDFGAMLHLYEANKENDEKIPRSIIVYNENGYSMNEQIRMIFNKYISESAGLQINISYQARNRLNKAIMNDEFVNNHDEQFLITFFDEAINEIHSLLTGSFSRFKRESVYSDIMIDQDRTDVNEQIIIAMQKDTKK